MIIMKSNKVNNSCFERLRFCHSDLFDKKDVRSKNSNINVISTNMENFSNSIRTQQPPSLLCLISNPTKRKPTATIVSIVLKVLSFIILNSILNHQSNYIKIVVNHNDYLATNDVVSKSLKSTYKLKLPTVILAGAIECQLDNDCARDKVCHENKCICARNRPIELDQDRCLPLALINEQCTVYEQCLGNSQCVDGICSCGNDAISLFNPSTNIYYCHPKRGLNEQCNHDLQCPSNSYCSTKKSGCLCLNGYAEGIVNIGGKETKECLQKFCKTSDTCESEYHECDDGKCKCLPSHFDPTNAKCYKFGSTGGEKSDDGLNTTTTGGNGENIISKDNDNNTIYTILKDLTENGDKMWLVLIILISLSIIIFVLIFLLLRKHYLGYCWTAHKKEYEPNTKNPPKNGYFNKNSINNKSFRQKSNGEVEDENEDDQANGGGAAAPMTGSDDSTVEDRSSLFSFSKKKKNNDNYIRVNVNDDTRNNYGPPLSTSTSTPV